MGIEERYAAARLQHRIHHTLGQTRLVAVTVGRSQPLLVVEETIALRHRQTAHLRLADHDSRHNGHGHLLAWLHHHRTVRRLRKVFRLVYDDADAFVIGSRRNVRFRLDVQQHIEADMLAVAGHPINGQIQLIGHGIAIAVAVFVYNISIADNQAHIFVAL